MIILTGRIPSKKNSTLTFARGNRVIHIPSNKYREWHKDATKQLLGQKLEKGNYLHITFYLPDNRRTDLTNKAESIMDLLVDNEFLEDDCWQVIPKLLLECKCVDKENPRVEIEVA